MNNRAALEERIAVVSDIHGNLPALEAVLADASREGATAVVCLGDLVGYSTFPVEVIRCIRSKEIPCVRGNHDMMAVGMLDPVDCGPNARRSIEWTRNILSEADRSFLHSLPEMWREGTDLLFTHSTVDDPVIYLRREEQFLAEGELIGKRHPEVRCCFTGHTHTAELIELGEGRLVRRLPAETTRLRESSFYFINPGSVGHPRREDYRASYALFDTAKRIVCFRKIRYARRHTTRSNSRHGIPTDLGPGVVVHRLREIRKKGRRALRNLMGVRPWA